VHLLVNEQYIPSWTFSYDTTLYLLTNLKSRCRSHRPCNKR